MGMMQEQLRILKISISESNSEELEEEFYSAENHLRLVELDKAHHLRRLACIRWLGQGDEASRFYFATLKAKRRREDMSELQLQDGSIITAQAYILLEVQRFCENLYSPAPLNLLEKNHRSLARKRLLSHTHNSLTPSNLAMLESFPSLREVKDTLWLLLDDKAPGPDGLTAEVFRSCWDFDHQG